MAYRIGICDDEKALCGELENYILEFAKNRRYDIEIDVWNTAESCCSDLRKFNPDFLFLDIELPGNSGLDVGKYIREVIVDDGMVIVFISHETNYAMELFQVHPYDFLIKPIEKEKIDGLPEKMISIYETNNKKFIFTYKNETKHILTGDIIYMRSQGKYIFIKTENEEHTFIGKLDVAKEQLPSGSFVSVNKSYVINMGYLKAVKSNLVTMSDGSVLSVSRSHRHSFQRSYMDYVMWGG